MSSILSFWRRRSPSIAAQSSVSISAMEAEAMLERSEIVIARILRWPRGTVRPSSGLSSHDRGRRRATVGLRGRNGARPGEAQPGGEVAPERGALGDAHDLDRTHRAADVD